MDEYYNNYDEEDRLVRRNGVIEYRTTMKYLHEQLDKLPKDKITRVFHCLSDPEALFSLVKVENIDELDQKLPIERYKLIATDDATGYMRSLIDEMTNEELDLFIEYH